jgi:hypothetical protein
VLDNRLAFVSLLMVKGMSCAVGLTWDLNTQYHPQSSGQVERMNRTQDSTSKTMSRDRVTLARGITFGTVQN